MTSMQWFTWIVAGPIVGVVVAVFLGGVRPMRVILGALIGVAVGYTCAHFWSNRALQRALSGSSDVMVAKADVSLTGRLTGVVVLIVIALGVAGLTLVLARVTRWGRA